VIDVFAPSTLLFWLYVTVGTIAAAMMGMLGWAWYIRRDVLSWWLTLMFAFVALDMYAKALLRSPTGYLPPLSALHLSRLSAIGMALVLLGLTDWYFASHNGHLDMLRRIVRWWDRRRNTPQEWEGGPQP